MHAKSWRNLKLIVRICHHSYFAASRIQFLWFFQRRLHVFWTHFYSSLQWHSLVQNLAPSVEWTSRNVKSKKSFEPNNHYMGGGMSTNASSSISTSYFFIVFIFVVSSFVFWNLFTLLVLKDTSNLEDLEVLKRVTLTLHHFNLKLWR